MLPDITQPTNALVVDDNRETREFVGRILQGHHFDVNYATDGDEGLSLARHLRPAVVYLDVNMPGQDGWLVCAKLKLSPSAPAVVLMTGDSRRNLYRFAEFVQADDVLRKPFSADDVIQSLPILQA